MGQKPSEKKHKVIITVRLDHFKKDLSQYSHFVEGCFEVYDKLFRKHSEVFTDEAFKGFLKNLKYQSRAEGEVSMFDGNKDYNYDDVFNNENFIDWLKKEDNKLQLLEKLKETKYDYLIRKHKTHEIYVVPVLNNNFAEENIAYIETLVKSIKRDDDIIYLLLHDKDLYDDTKKNHPVAFNDGFEKKLDQGSVLMDLIDDTKVFVFQHQPGNDGDEGDVFYNNVIMRLDEIAVDEIIKLLSKQASNIILGKELSKCMRTSDMQILLSKYHNGEYDFSTPFMDI